MSKQVKSFHYVLTISISESFDIDCDLPEYADNIAKQHFMADVLNISGSIIPSNFEDFIVIEKKEKI